MALDDMGLPYGLIYPQKDPWEDEMNLKDLIPEGVLNPEPNMHKTTQEDLDRMEEDLKREVGISDEPEIQFKNKIEFMQARAMARKILNSQKPKKKNKKKRKK